MTEPSTYTAPDPAHPGHVDNHPPAAALSAAEAATVARFETAPVPPEVRREIVARAMFERMAGVPWEQAGDLDASEYRTQADAALAAVPEVAAVDRVRAVAEELDRDDVSYSYATHRIRRALAEPPR